MKERSELKGYFDLFQGNKRTIPDKDRGTESPTDMTEVVRPAIEVLLLANTPKKTIIVEQLGFDGANELFMPETVKKNSNH